MPYIVPLNTVPRVNESTICKERIEWHDTIVSERYSVSIDSSHQSINRRLPSTICPSPKALQKLLSKDDINFNSNNNQVARNGMSVNVSVNVNKHDQAAIFKKSLSPLSNSVVGNHNLKTMNSFKYEESKQIQM